MKRSFLVLVLITVAACVLPEEPDDGPVVPLGGWGDDDDATDAALDFQSNVPVAPDSEGFSMDPCTMDQLLGSGCEELPTLVVKATVGPDCPLGERTIEQPEDWAALRTQCGLEDDPAADVDWESELLQLHVGEGAGCACSHEVLWVARCDDGPHVGYWFYPCGPCDEIFVRLTAATVPRTEGAAPMHACTPYDVVCLN